MKEFFKAYKLHFIIIISILFAAAMFGIYVYHFGTTLSGGKDDWGTFGDYLGGVLSVVFSFLTMLLLIYTLNDQGKKFDNQKFETNFFKLMELHNNTIQNLEIKKESLYEDEFVEVVDAKILRANEVLNELCSKEWRKMQEYFNIQAIRRNNRENLFVFNYRALNHHFIQTKDYLNSIVNNIIHLHNLIKKANIDPEEKLFYDRLLKDNLSDAQKFFIVIFYIQLNSSIKNQITVQELKNLCGPKPWILQPIVLNDKFPFCFPGICVGDSYQLDLPKNYYKIPLSTFLQEGFFYLVKIDNSNLKCESLSINFDNGLQSFTSSTNEIEFRNKIYHFDFKYFFKEYFCGGVDIENARPLVFYKNAKKYSHNNRAFILKVGVTMYLEEDKERKYVLKDNIQIQLHMDIKGEITITINSCKNIAWKSNWLDWSFRKDL